MCLYCRIHNRIQGVIGGNNFCLSKYLNDMKFDCRKLTDLFPVYRNEVYEDVVKRSTYGELGQMWLLAGHLFLTSKCRLKVFSFDFIPASRQQISDTGPLGFYFQHVTSPVLDVLDPKMYSHTMFVVSRNGQVQCWQFGEEYVWSVYAKFDLCNTVGTEVVSVRMDPTQKCIYWCEKRSATSGDSATYCICKRNLPDDFERIKNKDIGPVHAIVHNCPPSDVFVVGTSVIISNRPSEDSVHAMLVLNYDKSSTSMYIGGEEVMTELSPRPAVDFRTALIQCLPSVAKSGQYSGPVYIQFDPQRSQLAALQENWKLHTFQPKEDDSGTLLHTSTQFPDQSDVELDANKWFLTQNVFGVKVGNRLRLFSAKMGLPLHEVESPDDVDILGVCVSCIPTVLVGFFTSRELYIVQRAGTKPDSENMLMTPQGKTFQTDSLQVAYLSQEKQEAQSAPVVKRMSALHKRWKDGYSKQPRSRLSQLVDPYMAEFWRLEELVSSIAENSQPVSSETPTVESEVRNILFDRSSLPLDVQQAQLLWLCEKYPDEMLSVLTSDLQYELDDLDTEQSDQWQHLLGLEGEGTEMGGASLMLFENTCRLMYKLQPQILMRFVETAQNFSEQAVGVSAFVRKKQTFQYYKKALGCLPEADTSRDSGAAVDVKVKLILASDEGHDAEKAVKMLLEHQQWRTAIRLVQEQAEKSESRACLLYLTMAAMAQNQVLSEYAKEMFALIPSGESFLTFSEIIEKQPEVKQSRLSMSVQSVFCEGPPDIPISALRPVLLNMLSTSQTN